MLSNKDDFITGNRIYWNGYSLPLKVVSTVDRDVSVHDVEDARGVFIRTYADVDCAKSFVDRINRGE